MLSIYLHRLSSLLALCASVAHAQPASDPGREVTSVDITQEAPLATHHAQPPAQMQEESRQEQRPENTDSEPAEQFARWPGGPLDVGGATESLLALQRASQGARPRPIDGEQASRSYQRYLKSFEAAIPERFDTGLDVKQ
jgi:hypothetical protein